jgi:hypothetical protein
VGAVADDFAQRWFNHECVLLRGAGASPYGWQEGEPVPFKGFVRQSTRRVVGPEGEHTVTDTMVYVPLGLVVERGDRIELPDPFETGPWEVTERAAFDGAGNQTPDHQKLTLTFPSESTGGGVVNPYG